MTLHATTCLASNSSISVYSPDMEVVWAAVATGVFTLAGILGATWLSQRGEKERRVQEARLKEQQLAHERKLKKDELTHEHRARLYDARLTRYSEFLSVWLEYSRRQTQLSLIWGQEFHAQKRLSEGLDMDSRSELVTNIDALRADLDEAHRANEEAFNNLQEAITALQVVASTSVYESARTLEAASSEVFAARINLSMRPEEGSKLWGEFRDGQRKFQDAHAELRDAIRRELRLDDEDNIGEVPEA